PMLEYPPAAPASLADMVKKIKSDADRTKPDVFKEIAAMKTREAMTALHEVYDAMQTIFMKREVIRVMPAFDGVTDAEQPSLQKLMDISTGSGEVELREAALDAIGQYRGHGKDFLRLIVTSEAEDSVREKAMKLHVRLASKDDFAWYRELCIPKDDDKADKEHEKEAKEAKK